jgi:hypothetical protein
MLRDNVKEHINRKETKPQGIFNRSGKHVVQHVFAHTTDF